MNLKDQNIILTNIQEEKISKFKEESILNRFKLNPSAIAAGTVSCTVNSYCSFAMTNTKDEAVKILDSLVNENDVVLFENDLPDHYP